MKIFIGSDHVGYDLKDHIKEYVSAKGYEVVDCGPYGRERAEYPVYASSVAHAVVSDAANLGILICGTGIGISMAANKVKGIRAAVCSEAYSARLTRQHNNANIIAFGARVIGTATAEMIVDEFLAAVYEGGRHQNRVDMISKLESEGMLDAEAGY